MQLDPPLLSGELPPAVWRPNKPSADTSQTQVDLALFSRNPNVTNSALERSTDLSDLLISIWGDTCTQVAPPACVFWAFCGQRLGPSPDGWTLFGTPQPDPPNTRRTSPVPTEMLVEQPSFSGPDKLLMDLSLQLIGEGLQPAQVVGPGSIVPQAAPRAAAGRTCFRAVELPELLTAAFKTKLSSELDPTQGGRSAEEAERWKCIDSRWLRFHIGLSNRVRILMGIDPNLFKTSQGTAKSWFLIRERDINGNLNLETPLMTMNPVLVTAITNLPSTWIAAGSPWGLDATQVFSLLSSLELAVILLEFKPQPTTTTIEVAVTAPASHIPTLLVGAIESCPTSESDRFQNGVQIQDSTIQTIQGYLDGGTPVPLLQKDTLYTVTLNYDITVTEQDGSTHDFNNVTQAWQFRTDNKTPSKLDPWVLCTAPDMNEQHVFYEDPVDIVFNDNSIIQLFSQYGFALQMDLRAADGLPEPSGAPVTTVAINGVGTASYDALQELIGEGKLPCVGTTLVYKNQVFTAPVALRPLMAYTLDLVTSPSQLPPPDPNTPVTPLFRRTFATSKYPNMKALADDLGATRVSHRALKSRLSFSSSGGKDVRPDQDIQDLFATAGEQALPAADKNHIVIYWAPSAPDGPFTPHAILIDCTEPLWRTRPEPTFQNPIATDPSFQIVAIGAPTSLEVIEQGGPNIGGYLVSPGGTRTIAVFNAGFSPPAGGTTVTLALHRPVSSVYGNADEIDVIAALQIAPTAPWEDDHAASRYVWPYAFSLRTSGLVEALRQQKVPAVLHKFFPKSTGSPLPIALRWSHVTELGFPREPFQIFRRLRNPSSEKALFVQVLAQSVPIVTQPVLSTFAAGDAAYIVSAAVSVPTGTSVTVEALDIRSKPIPGQTVTITLNSIVQFRCPGIFALQAFGSGTIGPLSVVPETVYANLSDWQKIQTVGLPLLKGEIGAAYNTLPQGIEPAGLDGVAFAIERMLITSLLQVNPFGTGIADFPLPAWPAPDATAYVANIRSAKSLVPMIERCLEDSTDNNPAKQQSAYVETVTLPGIKQSNVPGATANPAQTTQAALPIVGVGMLAASTDSYAAVSLGYGTVDIPPQPHVDSSGTPPTVHPVVDAAFGYDYMVTAPFISPFFSITLAALSAAQAQVEAPASLQAVLKQTYPPIQRNQPLSASIRVSWQPPDIPQGYGILASRSPNTSEVLNVPRPLAIKGFDPFIGLVPNANDPATPPEQQTPSFSDATVTLPLDVPPSTARYLVAGLDVFGLWSGWMPANVTLCARGHHQARYPKHRIPNGPGACCRARRPRENAN